MSTKNFKAKALTASLGLLMASTQLQAEVSANVSMVSDYVFRGLSQSQEDPAIQGGFDWSSESGFYVGTWASSVDFVGSGTDDGADVEWDLYLGYGAAINDSWSWDVSYIQYLYPGTVSGVDYDYGELLLSFGYNDVVDFTLGYSNDVFNSSKTGIYYAVSGGTDIGENGWSWNATLGHYDLDSAPNASYTHYSLGLDKAFEKVTLNLSVHDTDGKKHWGDIAGSRFVIGLSTDF